MCIFDMKSKGSAIIEYVIPAALIGLVVGLGLYYMYQNNMLNKFMTTSMNANVDISSGKAILNPNLEPTDILVSQTSAPSTGCINGTCSLVFDNYILTGIPQDFSAFVETAGTSGGTDTFASLLDQLAQQLQVQGDEKSARELGRFRDLIRLEADMFRFVEDFVKNGADDKALNEMYFSKSMAEHGYQVPADLIYALPNVNINRSPSGLYAFDNEVGFGQYYISQGFTSNANTSTGYAIADQYNKIMSNSAYSDNMKSVISEIYKGVADLSYQGQAVFNATAQPTEGGSAGYQKYDPVTGKKLEIVNFNCGPVDNIVHPNLSLEVDILSSVKP